MRSLLSLRNLVFVIGITVGLMPLARAGNFTITLNGTVATTDPGMGYTVGDPVSMFWEVKDAPPSVPPGYVSATESLWGDYDPTHTQLFASVGGTGIAGTFGRAANPYGYISLYASGRVEIEHDEDNDGLYLAANPAFTFLYNFVDLVVTATGFTGFTPDAVLPNPTTYLATYAGTYSIDSVSRFEVHFKNGGTVLNATFAPTSMTIAPASPPAAVPEISQAGLAGVAALLVCGFGLVERRRRPALARA